MVKGSVVANSPLLYALIVVGLGIIIAYAIMSVKKASARCAELGIGSDVIKNVVKSTVVSSIVPSLAILLGFITLTVSLGAALPWWRLSVIGSLSYEAMAASYAANGLGVQLSDVLTSDATVFGAIMIVMSIGICTGPIMVTLFAKKYSTGIMQAKTGKSEFGQIMVLHAGNVLRIYPHYGIHGPAHNHDPGGQPDCDRDLRHHCQEAPGAQ